MGLFDFLKKKKVEEKSEESELLIEEGTNETAVLSEDDENHNINAEEPKEETKENEIFEEIKKGVEEVKGKEEIKTIEYIKTLKKSFDENDKDKKNLDIEDSNIIEKDVINIAADEILDKIEFDTSGYAEDVITDMDIAHEEHTESLDELVEALEEEISEEVELTESKEEISEKVELTELKDEESIEEQKSKKVSLFEKLKKGLGKTKDNIVGGLDTVLGSFTKIDEDLFEELEETLIMSDLGVDTSVEIIEKLRERVKKQRVTEVTAVREIIIQIISEILEENNKPLELVPPTIILVIGVNGVGKTTTIGKLTHRFISEGKSVQLAAADTFRAAAIDQLQVWADRSNVPLIKHQENGDPGAVVYDAVKSAKARKTDVLIIDTAGRLHNKKNLMEELRKINRIIEREYGEANLEVFLALDSTTGQNAMQQAKQFNEVANITGLILTKLDGTAKGGIIVSIKNELEVPVRFIGIGEKIDDLETFDASMFARALFE